MKSPIAIRPELEHHLEYKPGLSIDQIKRQYKLKKVVKLASNENPLGPSPKAVVAYRQAAARLFRYPETRSMELRRQIAAKFRVDVENVIIGAGSDEIIELLAKAYLTPFDEIIVSASAFLQYRIAGELMGAKVTTVPLKDMKHDLAAMAKAVTNRTKFLFIANPNNPTGTYNDKKEVTAFLKELPSHVMPVFDEAYFEFAAVNKDYPSLMDGFFYKRPMAVLRTFSKAYGLAGLRVGFGFLPEEMIKFLDSIRPPFNVSIPGQAAAQAALFDEAHIRKTVQLNQKEKPLMAKALVQLGFDVVPSAANFLLFKVAPHKGRDLFEKILKKGVVARSVDEYGLPEYLRVSIGRPAENKLFLTVLREVLKAS